MPNVVFALPYGLPATVRFLEAVVRVPGVRAAVVSQEDVSRVPESVRPQLAGHQRVQNALDADQLERAVRELARGAFGDGPDAGRVHALVGILEPMQEAMAEVRRRIGIPGMSPETARNFRDKAHMKDRFRAAGVPCARHALVHGPQDAAAALEHTGLPVVVKPPAGAGARSTWRADDLDTFRQCLDTARPSRENPVLVEEFVRGREHSFDSISIEGRHVLHSISHYYPTPLEVMQHPWIQWCVLLPRHVDGPQYADIHAAGRRALDVLGMRTGISHMEWFRREDGSIAISEVAARPPGAQFTSLLSCAYDTSFYRLWAELVCLGRCELPERRYAAGAVFLRGQSASGGDTTDRQVRVVHGLERAREKVGSLVVEARIPEPGQALSNTYEGEGYVLVRHPETEVVEQALKDILSTVRVEAGA